jgi:hypothetical protein
MHSTAIDKRGQRRHLLSQSECSPHIKHVMHASNRASTPALAAYFDPPLAAPRSR